MKKINNIDIYQERYLAHQQRKKQMLEPNYKETHKPNSKRPHFFDVIGNRRSTRIFDSEPLDDELINELLVNSILAPSSCDRHGICIKVYKDRVEKSLLSGKLVGGVGWVQRASHVLLLIADMRAYKSPNERDFMPYLDAGVLAEHLMLFAEACNIASCFVNPNLNEPLVLEDYELFCGAIALGNYKK